jgi:hypothetical protein
MYSDKMRELVKDSCPKGEKFLYSFAAMNPPSLWVAILTAGALYAFFMKHYWIGVTDKGAYFLRLNLMGKVSQTDTFGFKEIKAVTVKNSLLENVAKFEFANGRRLVLNISKLRKGDSEEALTYLQKKIA